MATLKALGGFSWSRRAPFSQSDATPARKSMLWQLGFIFLFWRNNGFGRPSTRISAPLPAPLPSACRGGGRQAGKKGGRLPGYRDSASDKKKKGGKEGKKQLLRGYGFWLDSSVVNPALSFRDWLIYGGKLCFSSPSTKRATSECVACRRTPAVTLSWKWCRCLEGRCFLPALGYLTRWILQMGSCLILRSD